MKQLLITSLQTTSIQILIILAIFLGFGTILAFFQKRVITIYRKYLGWSGVLMTAWIGTPIHELGHLLFALIFRYNIKEVKLFEPNPNNKRMGYVNYSYSKYNPIHRIGEFLVGSGPLLLGSSVILILLYFLVPNSIEILQISLQVNPNQILKQVHHIFLKLFSINNLKNYQFWIFLYLSFAIITHISPSKRDRTNIWKGAVWLTLILIIINILGLFLFDYTPNQYIQLTEIIVFVIFSVFFFSLLIAASHYIILKIIDMFLTTIKNPTG